MGRKLNLLAYVVLFISLITELALFNYHWAIGCGWQFKDSQVRILFLADPQLEGNAKILRQGRLGELDLHFNDLFISHVYHTALRLQAPTHVVILGDVFSSEFIDLGEFNHRVARFGEIVKRQEGIEQLVLAGNHDIGYGAMMGVHHVDRFERAFGGLNGVKSIGGHRVVWVNSMNLDGANQKKLQEQTWNFVREMAQLQAEDPQPLILLTHIPLHKPAGHCVDEPLINLDRAGNVIKQNMLSPESSKFLLEKLKPKFVFSGHDHEGCAHVHVSEIGIPEFTVRSVMADYGGNSAFFEIRTKPEREGYEYAYSDCPFLDHVWVKVVSITGIVGLLLSSVILACCSRTKTKQKAHQE